MIRFGTCSWKYGSWQGIIYSEKAKENYLLEYAQSYPTVEIDQWFWSLFGVDKVSLPLERVVIEYTKSVPDDFKFTIKIPNSVTLTHFYRKSKTAPLEPNPYFFSVDLFQQFIETLQPMFTKIGVLMFQYALEIRNPNFLRQSYFNFLNERKLGHVFLQGYFMPPIATIYTRYWNQIRDISVIRLHGPDRSDIEEKSKGIWNRILEPKTDELSEITRIIRELNEKNLDVYVNVNNHYEGSAPLTIERIKEFLNAE
jgi:uncharacterized protein YecE (DUF72 family)